MDTRVDQLCDDLRRKLNGIERHVRDLKSKIERDREATIATIGEEIVVARAELKRAMDDAEAARVRMKAHLAESLEGDRRSGTGRHAGDRRAAGSLNGRRSITRPRTLGWRRP